MSETLTAAVIAAGACIGGLVFIVGVTWGSFALWTRYMQVHQKRKRGKHGRN